MLFPFDSSNQKFGKVEMVYVWKIGEHLRLDNGNIPVAVEHAVNADKAGVHSLCCQPSG